MCVWDAGTCIWMWKLMCLSGEHAGGCCLGYGDGCTLQEAAGRFAGTFQVWLLFTIATLDHSYSCKPLPDKFSVDLLPSCQHRMPVALPSRVTQDESSGTAQHEEEDPDVRRKELQAIGSYQLVIFKYHAACSRAHADNQSLIAPY